ncbi:phospholipase D family protein [Halomonas getboli]|uniref:phospholipase D family protein n=1 Tax=Halomonas getboli TaxID=2935862 RepID=UPI00200012A5|nr:phospholipase D family protein [Halomonas getboli]MCK2185460.1 phospholipase D family protein [Halomonas getboli]
MTRSFPGRSSQASVWLALAMLLWLTGCSPLPPLEGRSETQQLPVAQARQTALGEMVSPLVAQHDDIDGFHALRNARDAFAARLLLAESAERTLDVQYYIWHDDITGSLLYRALLDAADRGVRVRMLLDDTNTTGLDHKLAALDAHPNIEVRLFNPFVIRSPRFVGYLTDFSRANRRMHNKSFTADNQATIIGGRNIGDEYFGAATDMAFSDLDVLAIGPIVQDVSSDFDRYWSSRSAYPASRLIDSAGREGTARLEAQLDELLAQPEARGYLQALEEEPLIQRLREGRLPLIWAEAKMVSDDPAKGLGEADDEALLTGRIRGLLGPPEQAVYLVSPYFVPMDKGTRLFTDLEAHGVDVTILTNALEATDVGAVHAGYAKHRRELLEAGVRLFELKRQPGAPGRSEAAGPFGSKGASLHAKTFSVDGKRLFVGSFNFDPRSAKLNTELGFVIESPELAQEMAEVFREDIPGNAYEVRLDDNDDLVWLERTDDGTIRHHSEPNVGLLRRGWVTFISVLPIDWML